MTNDTVPLDDEGLDRIVRGAFCTYILNYNFLYSGWIIGLYIFIAQDDPGLKSHL